MKEKILTLVIGILIGAILATGGFLIYNKTNSKNNVNHRGERPQMMQNGNGDGMRTPPNMQNGSNQGNGNNMETPPEKPSDDNQSSQSTPPDMQSNNSQTNNNNSNNS